MNLLCKVLPIALLLVAVASTSLAQRSPSFQAWEGSWFQPASEKRLATGEQWKLVSENHWSGTSYQIKDGDTLWQERVQLIIGYKNETRYTVTATNAQGESQGEPVAFLLTSFNPKKWVFENPTHDYPRRISYQLINKNQLTAFIDEGGKGEQRLSFRYHRVQQ
jgi:hypothetical protein